MAKVIMSPEGEPVRTTEWVYRKLRRNGWVFLIWHGNVIYRETQATRVK